MHAGAARAHGERIALMISLEMLGYYGDRAGSQRYPPLFRWFYPDRGNLSRLRLGSARPGGRPWRPRGRRGGAEEGRDRRDAALCCPAVGSRQERRWAGWEAFIP